MKKILFLLSLFILCTFKAQLAEVDLPVPNGSMPDYNNERTIYYGKTPPNWNGKTIIFTHGFTATASGMIKFDYPKTYTDKYRTVYISTTRGGSMMLNAELFAEGLDQVKSKLQTSKFYMYGYSNGGKSIDIALSLLGKQDMAIKVAMVATPLWGTPLANVGKWPVLSWIAGLTSLSDGLFSSTTYYMDAIRSAVDGSVNDSPDKYYTFVHTGYWNSKNDFWSFSWVPMVAAGTIIKIAGWGANDGICPYTSNIKRGGHVMLPEGGPRNHVTTAYDIDIWKKIKEVFDEDSSLSKATLKTIPESDLGKQVESSNYQLIYNENPQVIIKKDSEKYAITRLTKDKERSFLEKPEIKDYTKGIYNGREEGGSQEKYLDIYVDVNNAGFKMERDKLNNKLLITNIDASNINGSIIKTAVFKVSEEPLMSDSKVEDLAFVYNVKKKAYIASLDSYDDGVYMVNIHVENNDYARDLISGFVKGVPKMITDIKEYTTENSKFYDGKISIVKNIDKYPTVIIEEKILTPVTITFYDASGKIVYNNRFNTPVNQIIIPETFTSGLYFVKVSFNSKEKVIKFLE